jgi:2-polyprenyl-3-methyl-5-hydroxy-6-metoxy-1,4-benzoquinol methylase
MGNIGLDDYTEAYSETFKYALDNDLIIHDYVKRVAARLSGDSILDLGIGHGISTEVFSRSVARYIVIEGSSEIIRQFKEKKQSSGVEIIESNFEHFETDEKFDNVIMGFILEHVDDPDFIVGKYKKYLKKVGSLYITVPNSEALNRRLGYEAGLLEDLELLSDFDRQLGHKRYFNLKKLKELAQRHGMGVVSAEGLFMKPITTEQIKQLQLNAAVLNAMMKVGTDYPELCTAILIEMRHQ